MNARRAGLGALLFVSACKLDTMVFSGDTTDRYVIPSTVIPDSLRREVTFASGGETLHGFWLRHPGTTPRFTVVFSHGKGGNLGQDVEWHHAENLWRAGYDVLTYDYRGFGLSTGTSVDETTIYADANAALAFALTQPGVTTARVIVYGHSLGSAPAIALAHANPGIRALVIEAGFESGQAMQRSAAQLDFPVQWLLRGPLDNVGRIRGVRAPVLVIHGDHDVQIPVAQGIALYDAANDPRRLVIVPGAGHEDIAAVMGLSSYIALLVGFAGVAPGP